MIDTTQQDDGFWSFCGVTPPKDAELLHTISNIAQNNTTQTTDLVVFALYFIQKESESGEDTLNPALLVLQQRVTPEVVSLCATLCCGENPAERYLGVLILREFPALDQPHPFATEAIEILEQLVSTESEEMILAMGLSALGWQKDPRVLPIIITFAGHPSPMVRLMIADNLILSCPQNDPFPDPVAETYAQFVMDPDLDVRWYSFATLTELPELYGKNLSIQAQSDLLELFKIGQKDEHDLVRQEASEGYALLMKL